MIYHVTNKKDWATANNKGFYGAPSLEKEGFIHCSTKSQVAGVLERYYQQQDDLVLLHIDEALLTADIKFENAPSINEEFPHIFGTINLDAVVDTEEL